MIVVDASVVVELLIEGPLADEIRITLNENSGETLAPHLLDVEVISALRNLLNGNRIDQSQCKLLLLELSNFPAERYGHTALLSRIWDLRHNFTAYDAAYIALAEATGATLVTCDKRLRKGHRARIKVFAPS